MCLENPEIRGKSMKLRHLAAKTTKGKRPVNFLCTRSLRTMAPASLPPSKSHVGLHWFTQDCAVRVIPA